MRVQGLNRGDDAVNLAAPRHLYRMGSITGALLLIAVVLGGCSDASPGDPAPPSGGREYVLDVEAYGTVIAPVLTGKGCDNLACHGGGLRGTFQLSPFDDKDLAYDFDQVALHVDPADPAASSLLMKPLDMAAGGDVHTADSENFGFMSTGDPDYQAILNWIEEGEYR